jgi:hypothetical protein
MLLVVYLTPLVSFHLKFHSKSSPDAFKAEPLNSTAQFVAP